MVPHVKVLTNCVCSSEHIEMERNTSCPLAFICALWHTGAHSYTLNKVKKKTETKTANECLPGVVALHAFNPGTQKADIGYL